jgi:hypothetical protein
MKANVTVILDLENKKIINLKFENRLLDNGAGVGAMCAFIRRRVLNTPIEHFTALKYFPNNDKLFYSIDMEIDVYPLIKKIQNSVVPRLVPFRLKLSPLPIIGKESDISFEDYSEMYKVVREARDKLRNSMSPEEQ